MKNLKTVFKSETVEILKVVPQKREKISYVVDTCFKNEYMCIPNGNETLAAYYGPEELRKIIENDSENEYVFTKEAYAQCKEYFSKIAL